MKGPKAPREDSLSRRREAVSETRRWPRFPQARADSGKEALRRIPENAAASASRRPIAATGDEERTFARGDAGGWRAIPFEKEGDEAFMVGV